MTAIFYNPCDDGIRAKIWECLRRNPEFSAWVNKEQRRPKGQRAWHWGAAIERARSGNACAAVALEYLLPLSGEYRGRSEVPGTAIDFAVHWRGAAECRENGAPPPLDVSWKKIPNGVQRAFLGAWEEDLAPMPRILGHVSSENIGKWNDVIAVPNVIRDSAHRKAIIKKLESLVRPAERMAHRLDTGSFLGSKQEWSAYLVFEHYVQEIKNGDYSARRKHALLLAAWQYVDQKDFESWPERKKVHKAGLDFASKSYDVKKQLSHIDNRVASVENAILKIYPVFHKLEPPEDRPQNVSVVRHQEF